MLTEIEATYGSNIYIYISINESIIYIYIYNI